MKSDIFQNILKQSKNSKKLFLIDENKTYNDFYINTLLFFDFFKKILKKKETICICSGYSLNFVSLIFAAYLNRNVITFINPNASKNEKKHVVNNSSSSIIFFEKNYLNFKKKNNTFLNFKFVSLNKKSIIKSNNIRFIIYTSGTINKAKGVLLSNDAISSNIRGIAKNIKLKKKDRGIIFSPPAYAMGISQILTFMYIQNSIVFYNHGVRFPRELINKIKNNKLSILNISISAFRIIQSYLKKNEKFKNLRLVMSGGMQFSEIDFKLYKKFFPNAKFFNFYGCTENSPRISHYCINSKKNYNGFFPVGKPIDGVKIKIKKDFLKKSKIGTILVSGTSLMSGYLKLKKLNNNKINNGWFNTGDLGFFDKNKDLYLVGRNDNTFRVGHEKLFPEEIESKIQKKFKIQEVAIVKIKDKILNWAPICVIVKKSKKINIPVKNILNEIQNSFSSYKMPKKIIFLKKIPKTNYGKINRSKLEDEVSRLYG